MGVKHKAWDPELAQKRLQTGRLAQCVEGHSFIIFNCYLIFNSQFYTFHANKGFSSASDNKPIKPK